MGELNGLSQSSSDDGTRGGVKKLGGVPWGGLELGRVEGGGRETGTGGGFGLDESRVFGVCSWSQLFSELFLDIEGVLRALTRGGCLCV